MYPHFIINTNTPGVNGVSSCEKHMNTFLQARVRVHVLSHTHTRTHTTSLNSSSKTTEESDIKFKLKLFSVGQFVFNEYTRV